MPLDKVINQETIKSIKANAVKNLIAVVEAYVAHVVAVDKSAPGVTTC